MTTPSNSPYTPDLRGFIAFLEKEHPEQVVRISREVDPKFGVSGILERLERDGKFPLVIFENVKGSKIPLVANMHASFFFAPLIAAIYAFRSRRFWWAAAVAAFWSEADPFLQPLVRRMRRLAG